MSEPTKAPAWHDAPTCVGEWVCYVDGRFKGIYKVLAQSPSWSDGSRYFGPIPPDPEASK